MSRYCGAWVGLKCLHDAVESSAVIDGVLDRVAITVPDVPFDLGGRSFRLPAGGLNIRLHDTVLDMEARLHEAKRGRHARLRPRQPAQPHRRLRRADGANRRHHHRQELARRASGRSTISASTERVATKSD